jgi:hypothetical protein
VPAPGEFRAQLQGRCGTIEYTEASNRLDIFWEMSASPRFDVLVHPRFHHWTAAPDLPIAEQHQLEILAALRIWLKTQGLRSDIDAPDCEPEIGVSCQWRACNEDRLTGYAYCSRHLDSALLGIERDDPRAIA